MCAMLHSQRGFNQNVPKHFKYSASWRTQDQITDLENLVKSPAE